jgi:hypothetical protein
MVPDNSVVSEVIDSKQALLLSVPVGVTGIFNYYINSRWEHALIPGDW